MKELRFQCGWMVNGGVALRYVPQNTSGALFLTLVAG